MKQRIDLQPYGHVLIVGKNDNYWSITFPKGRLVTGGEPGVFNRFKKHSAQTAAASEVAYNNLMAVEPDFNWMRKIEAHLTKALFLLAESNLWPIAKMVLTIEHRIGKYDPQFGPIDTLAMGWDKNSKDLVLLINPEYLYKVVFQDKGKGVSQDKVIAYLLMHECLHALRGHMGHASYQHRIDNIVEDLAINLEVSKALGMGDFERSMRNPPKAVDGGLINPFIMIGELNSLIPEDFVNGSRLLNGGVSGTDRLENPVLIKIDVAAPDERGMIQQVDPTAVLKMMTDVSSNLRVYGRIDDFKSQTQAQPEPEPPEDEDEDTPPIDKPKDKEAPIGLKLVEGLLVEISATKELGVVVSVDSEEVTDAGEVKQKLKVVKVADLPFDLQNDLFGQFDPSQLGGN